MVMPIIAIGKGASQREEAGSARGESDFYIDHVKYKMPDRHSGKAEECSG